MIGEAVKPTPRTARPKALAQTLIPFALAALFVMAIVGLWGHAIFHTIDRLKGVAEPREDIVAFYVAGKLVLEGRAARLYDLAIVSAEEEAVLGRPAGYHGALPYLNPPFVAGLLSPLAVLPYDVAQAVWLGIGVATVAASLALLLPELRRLDRRWAILAVLGALAFFPVYFSFLYGQLSPFLLLSWVLSYRFLKAGREYAAGAVLALCLIKPQLALVPALFLLVTGRWRAVAGFAVGATLTAAVSLAIVGPAAAFSSYPRLVLESAGWRSEYGIDRPHMFGWNGLFSLLLEGRNDGLEQALSITATVVTLLAAIYIWRRLKGSEKEGHLALAVAAAAILANPHVHTQDLQILILPAVLLLSRRCGRSDVLLPAALFVLVPVALTGANLVTPVLAVSMGLLAEEASAGALSRFWLALVRAVGSERALSTAKGAVASAASAALRAWRGASREKEASHAEP